MTMLASLCRLHDALSRATFWLAGASVVYIMAVTAFEVVTRYVFAAPTDWAPDTSVVALAGASFLAAPELARRHAHVAMTFGLDALKPVARAWLVRAIALVGLITCGIVGVSGVEETMRQIDRGVMMITVTPLPKWLVTMLVAYAFTSMALYFARQLLASFASQPDHTEDGAWSGTYS